MEHECACESSADPSRWSPWPPTPHRSLAAKATLLRKIDTRADAALLESELLGILVCRAFITVRQRNAWHETTSSQYRGESSLNVSLDAAKGVAEEWRKQGSHFLIREVAAIALLSPLCLAVTVDFYHDDSFGYWDVARGKQSLRRGNALEEPLRSLGHMGDWAIRPDRNSIVRGVELFATVRPVGARARFSAYTSISDGPRYYLRWLARDVPTVSARGAHRIRRAFASINESGAIARGLDEFEAAKKQRREDVFHRLKKRAEARIDHTSESARSR